MGYTNPAASASDALAQFLLQQQQLKRQAMLDEMDMKLKQASLDKAQQEKAFNDYNMAAQQQDRTPIGAVVSPAQKAAWESAGAPGTLTDQPEVAAAPATTSIGSGEPGTTIGEGDAPAPVSTTPAIAGHPAQTVYDGNDRQQEEAQKKLELAHLMARPDVPEAYKVAVQTAMLTGKSPAFELLQAPKDATEGVFRQNPSNKGAGVDRLVNGQWVPWQGDVPKGAHFMTVPQPPMVVSVNPSDSGQSAAIDMLAKRLATSGDTSGLGRGGVQSPLGQEVAKRAAMYNKDSGQFDATSAPNLAANKASFTADSKALNVVQTNYDTVKAFVRTAEGNAKLYNDIVEKVPNFGAPFLSTPIRALAVSAFGNVAVSNMRILLKSVRAEYARILNTANLSGQVTLASQEELNSLLSDGATPEMVHGALDTLNKEANSRMVGYETQIKEIQDRIKGGPKAGGNATPPEGNYNPATGKVE